MKSLTSQSLSTSQKNLNMKSLASQRLNLTNQSHQNTMFQSHQKQKSHTILGHLHMKDLPIMNLNIKSLINRNMKTFSIPSKRVRIRSFEGPFQLWLRTIWRRSLLIYLSISSFEFIHQSINTSIEIFNCHNKISYFLKDWFINSKKYIHSLLGWSICLTRSQSYQTKKIYMASFSPFPRLSSLKYP